MPPLLRREGHRVRVQLAAEGLTELVAEAETDLLILDPKMISPGSLFKVCHTIRKEGTMMLLLVGRAASSDQRVSALEAGADDYLSEPFDLDELLARVHALFRRHPLSLFGQGLGLVWLTEDLWLDLAGRRLVGRIAGQPLDRCHCGRSRVLAWPWRQRPTASVDVASVHPVGAAL